MSMNNEAVKTMRQRESGIELLRIICMISIVVLHYFSFGLLPVFGATPPIGYGCCIR